MDVLSPASVNPKAVRYINRVDVRTEENELQTVLGLPLSYLYKAYYHLHRFFIERLETVVE